MCCRYRFLVFFAETASCTKAQMDVFTLMQTARSKMSIELYCGIFLEKKKPLITILGLKNSGIETG